MIYIDELKNMKLYNKKFLLPINSDDKLHGNSAMLLTPNMESSVKTLNHPLLNPRYYNSYYIEKDVSYLISNENTLEQIDRGEYIHESSEPVQEMIGVRTEKRLIFNGYRMDIEAVRGLISIEKIEYINQEYFRTDLSYPISVTVYPKNADDIGVKSTIGSINVACAASFSEEQDFEFHCREQIVEMIIRNINPDINDNFAIAISYVISGRYNAVRADIKGEPIDSWCSGIERLMNENLGNAKLRKSIEKNDFSKVVKLTAKELNANMRTFVKSFTESEKMDDFARLKRNITTQLNKGTKHQTNSVASSAEDLAKRLAAPLPNAEAPIATVSSDTSSEKEEEDVEESYNILLDHDIIDETYSLNLGNHVTFFNEADRSVSNTQLRKLLYNDRLKANKDVFLLYDDIKPRVPYLNKMYIRYDRYKKFNLFIDLHYYNKLFFEANTFQLDRGIDLYFELLKRMINDKAVKNAGYNNKTIIIPIRDWDLDAETKMWIYKESINPISMIYRLLQTRSNELKAAFGDTTFVFLSDTAYFKMQFDQYTTADFQKFLIFIKTLRSNNPIIEDDIVAQDSKKAITDTIIGGIEDSKGIKMYALTGKLDGTPVDAKKDVVGLDAKNKKSEEISTPTTKSIDKQNSKAQIDRNKADKEAIIAKVDNAAANSDSVEDAIEKLDQDEEFKRLLMQLEDDNPEVKINAARASRINELNNSFMQKQVQGMSVKDILEKRDQYEEEKLKPAALPIDSINPEWQNLTYVNMAHQYDPNTDIVAMLQDLASKSYPISIRDITVEDTSTSEDYIYTYKVECESHAGKRFSLKFDIPILKNDQYMKLRGNKKTISTQQFLMPIIKTEEDTVQIVSNYNKIFVRRFGTTTGKSNVVTDRLIKTFNKGPFKDITLVTGDNSRICSRYDLPIDYIDLSSIYTRIETTELIFMFNQYEVREKFKDKIDESKGIPVGYYRKDEKIIYFDPNEIPNYTMFSMFLRDMLIGSSTDKDFGETYQTTAESVRYTYSKASILTTEIPIAVLTGYSVGLVKMMDIAGVKYELVEKRPPKSADSSYDMIKFRDGYIKYQIDYNSSLLMNGLKECDTANYSITDINSKAMYLDFLDQFGGRIKADGIDNFYDCMIDPITRSGLNYYKLPDNYIGLLLYSNHLLADNKYDRHGNVGTKRLRRNELIAAYACKALLVSYGQYATQLKHGRDAAMSIKQSAVIDAILSDPTAGDISVINALNEKESYDAVSPKGLSGMNSDRAYSLDKRSYDESMINVLGMSTGFAGNVGITRQATINASVDSVRGYIKPSTTEEMNSVNSLCMTEAISVYSSTRDDPFRTAMTFVQTSKHTVRSKSYTPALVTTGADQALPYMISDDFAFKAKDNGKVVELTDEYIILQYKSGAHEYVNLKEECEKNSSTGFFVTLKLDTDLKIGSTFKKGEIIACDSKSFNNSVGISDNYAYSFATLVKCALMDTDEGFEDSAIVDEELAEALTTEVVKEKSVVIPKNTNVFNLVKIGQTIQEGDPLMIMQSPYDEEDAAILLKNLVDTEEEISELGRIPIRSKVTGIVQDIKVYRTVEIEEMSESLQKICKEYESGIKKKKSMLNKYGIQDNTVLNADYALPATGKLKDANDSIKIIFYLKYVDRFGIGDKLIYYNANKGVCKDKIQKGKEPYSLDRPDERLHTLVSIVSINGRMVSSIQNIGVQTRLLIEESRTIKDIAGIKYNVNLLEE